MYEESKLMSKPNEGIYKRNYIYVMDYRDAKYFFEHLTEADISCKHLTDIQKAIEKYSHKHMDVFQCAFTIKKWTGGWKCDNYTWSYGQKTTMRTKRWYNKHQYLNDDFVISEGELEDASIVLWVIDSDSWKSNMYNNSLHITSAKKCYEHKGKEAVFFLLHHLTRLSKGEILSIPQFDGGGIMGGEEE